MENHIDSTYVGYLLGIGKAFPVSMGTDPEHVVSTLLEGRCISKHPIASYTIEGVDKQGKRYSKRIREPMHDYIQSQKQRIDDYLAIHPEFFERDGLELSRAYLSLALGDTESALGSLLWVKENSAKVKWTKQASEIIELLRKEEPMR
jgi:hypothetical protein